MRILALLALLFPVFASASSVNMALNTQVALNRIHYGVAHAGVGLRRGYDVLGVAVLHASDSEDGVFKLKANGHDVPDISLRLENTIDVSGKSVAVLHYALSHPGPGPIPLTRRGRIPLTEGRMTQLLGDVHVEITTSKLPGTRARENVYACHAAGTPDGERTGASCQVGSVKSTM